MGQWPKSYHLFLLFQIFEILGMHCQNKPDCHFIWNLINNLSLDTKQKWVSLFQFYKRHQFHCALQKMLKIVFTLILDYSGGAKEHIVKKGMTTPPLKIIFYVKPIRENLYRAWEWVRKIKAETNIYSCILYCFLRFIFMTTNWNFNRLLLFYFFFR